MSAANQHRHTFNTSLAQLFQRVAIFRIEDTQVTITSVQGLPPQLVGKSLSLLQPTPLRAAIEAASPIVEAGCTPHNHAFMQLLGIEPPRGFVVVPWLRQGRLVALAYADQGDSPLPLQHVAALLRVCAAPPPAPPRTAAPEPVPHAAAAAALLEDQSAPAVEQLPRPAPAPQPQTQQAQSPAQAMPPPPPPRRHRPRRTGGWPPAVKLAALVLLLAAPALLVVELSPPPAGPQAAAAPLPTTSLRSAPTEEAVFVTVAPQTSLGAIAQQLKQAGVIRNAALFTLMASVTAVDRQLQAGRYRFAGGLWPWQVLAELHRGQVQTGRVTVREGMQLREVAEHLERLGLASAAEIMHAARNRALLDFFGIPASSVEGYLFPETYEIAIGLAPLGIIKTMVEEFFDRITTLPAVQTLDPEQLHARVVLASVVESEAGDTAEMARIAGVFTNRVARGMRLESCATVQYALAQRKEKLSVADVRTPSPYNTYLHRGLPPGPIANPSLAALAAAMEPEAHDYLFFFARHDGSNHHIFTRTYSAHKSALARWRKSAVASSPTPPGTPPSTSP